MRRRALLSVANANSGGGGSGEEIVFYINTFPIGGTFELTAIDGMTWGEFVSTEYNTLDLYINEDFGYVEYPPFGFPISAYGAGCKAEDIIIADFTYEIG